MDPFEVISHPLATEKSIRLMESENKLVFVVGFGASKKQVKEAIEAVFKVKVDSVKTFIVNGEKRAYVRLKKDSPAIDVATQLGLM
ncbi:50S ribosomal protein L23 [Candidatus Woesearchaeota archaeon]|nr:50S ribosomal protein L23 [Candidatus Woesearchaeota archaeon]